MKGRRPNAGPGLRLVGGNDGGDGGDDESSGLPEAPEHLGDFAREEWDRVVPELVRLKRWLPSFQARIEQYCNAYQRWRQAEQQIVAIGPVVKSPKGYPMQSPFLAISNKAVEQMTSIADRFGFDVLAQVRLRGAQLDLFDQPETGGPSTDPVGDAWAGFGD